MVSWCFRHCSMRTRASASVLNTSALSSSSRSLPSKPSTQPSSLWLLLRHLQPFAPPDPLDALVVAPPALGPQQGGDPPVAVAPVLPRPVDDRRSQRRLVVGRPRHLALRRTVLSQHPAREALGDVQLRRDVLDAGPTTRGAHGFPDAASFSTGFSSVRSATALRNLPFSVSSGFSRFT